MRLGSAEKMDMHSGQQDVDQVRGARALLSSASIPFHLTLDRTSASILCAPLPFRISNDSQGNTVTARNQLRPPPALATPTISAILRPILQSPVREGVHRNERHHDLSQPRCGTSRNTLAMIRNSGVEPLVIEYLKTPPTREQLVALIAASGLSVREVMRSKEEVFGELGLTDTALSDDALLDAMMAHPILINRPIVVTPLGTRPCRPSELVLEILPQGQQAAFCQGRRPGGGGRGGQSCLMR